MLGCAGAAALAAGPHLDTALVQQIASALVLERPFPDVPNELTEAQVYATQAAAVEADVGASRFIAGLPRPPQSDGQMRELRVSLSRDTVPIAEGSGADALGDPLLAAYRWMVEQVRARGCRLEPGMLLITGALGPVVDALPGAHVARFGPLGELEFTIR